MKILMRCSLFLVLVIAWASLHAEIIELKNGNKLTGTLTGITGDTFIVKTDYGDIKVPRSDVVSITFPENQPKTADADSPTQIIDESLVKTLYVNRTANFQATFPEGWKLSPELRKGGGNGTVAALMSEDQASFFAVTDEKFGGTLATYQVLAETQYSSNFANYAKLEESPVELDGRKGVRLVVHGAVRSANATGNTTLKFLVYILPYEGRMVRVSLFTLEPLFDGAKPVFEKIAASYKSLSPQ